MLVLVRERKNFKEVRCDKCGSLFKITGNIPPNVENCSRCHLPKEYVEILEERPLERSPYEVIHSSQYFCNTVTEPLYLATTERDFITCGHCLKLYEKANPPKTPLMSEIDDYINHLKKLKDQGKL